MPQGSAGGPDRCRRFGIEPQPGRAGAALGGGAAVALLAQRLQGGHRGHDAAFREHDKGLGAPAQLGPKLELAAMQLDEVLDDRQTESRAALRRLVGEGPLAEGLQQTTVPTPPGPRPPPRPSARTAAEPASRTPPRTPET